MNSNVKASAANGGRKSSKSTAVKIYIFIGFACLIFFFNVELYRYFGHLNFFEVNSSLFLEYHGFDIILISLFGFSI